MQDVFLHLVQPRIAPEVGTNHVGLPLEGGATAPFVVDRGWAGPAGTYIEEWSIRRGEQVLYRHPPAYIQVRGHQTVRRFSDTVRVPLALEPGEYDITFVIGKYKMGSITVDAAPLADLLAAAAAPPPPAEPAPVTPRPVPPAARVAAPASPPAAPAGPYVGDDPAVVRERVYKEELAKGSDARVAEARAKSAEMRAKKAMAAGAAAPRPAPEPAAVAAAAVATSTAPAAEKAEKAGRTTAAALAAQAPPGGGGMSVEEAVKVRELVYAGAIEEGVGPKVAEARAKAAQIRAQRGPWWRPDWK